MTDDGGSDGAIVREPPPESLPRYILMNVHRELQLRVDITCFFVAGPFPILASL